ncbi:unnamed protein product [Allacma fusca]|uniref:Uncharacterized protein n=1 Tax=Allacma fusca TaxID=39272 RepID=A0A8J2KFG1_9HEXA|nr:unnamed protein product [Allacma fusca]
MMLQIELSDEEYPPFTDNSQTGCKIRAEAVINFFNASTYSYIAANIMANSLRYISGKGLGFSGEANEYIVTPPPDIEALGFRRLDTDIMKSVGKTFLRDDTPIEFGRKYDRFVSGGFVPGTNGRGWREETQEGAAKTGPIRWEAEKGPMRKIKAARTSANWFITSS